MNEMGIDLSKARYVVVYETDHEDAKDLEEIKRFLRRVEQEHSEFLTCLQLVEKGNIENFPYNSLTRKVTMYLDNQIYEIRKELL